MDTLLYSIYKPTNHEFNVGRPQIIPRETKTDSNSLSANYLRYQFNISIDLHNMHPLSCKKVMPALD